MAVEKYLEFLLLKRSCFFSPEIRKPNFAHLPFQKNRRRRRCKLSIIASMLACNSVELRCSILACTYQWLQVAETAFTDKEWYDNFRASKTTFEYIVSRIEDEIGHQDTSMLNFGSARQIVYTYHFTGPGLDFQECVPILSVLGGQSTGKILAWYG